MNPGGPLFAARPGPLSAAHRQLPVPVPRGLKACVRHLACGEAVENVERLRKILDEYCCDEGLKALPEEETDWREVTAEINARLPDLYVGRPKIEV